jgi:hypothetical protein
VVQEIDKDIEDLGLDTNRLTTAAQLVEAVVEFTVVETIEHRAYSGPSFPL